MIGVMVIAESFGIKKRIGFFVFFIIFLLVPPDGAQAESLEASGLAALIQLGLENSLDRSAARWESKIQNENEILGSRARNIPQIILTASSQKYHYDSLYETGTGNFVNNDGRRSAFGITVSYDLQKLFDADAELAKRSSRRSKIQEKISGRDVIRNIKKGYYGIVAVQSEIDELKKVITLFARIEKILKKQKGLGIYNEIERKQFQLQKSILESDLGVRSSDLEAAYFQLSLVMNVSAEDLKERVAKIKERPKLYFAPSKISPEKLSALSDPDILESLGGNYDLAKTEYESFHSLALPTVYVREAREMPTMPSSEGPQTITEVGLSFPIDSFFTRSARKSQLSAKSEKAEVLFRKALLEYRDQIRLNAMNMRRYQDQASRFEATRKDAESLLDKSFLFYAQKRIDVLGTLDIFQKYLQAVRNDLNNKLQIQVTDAELEYLVGRGA